MSDGLLNKESIINVCVIKNSETQTYLSTDIKETQITTETDTKENQTDFIDEIKPILTNSLNCNICNICNNPIKHENNLDEHASILPNHEKQCLHQENKNMEFYQKNINKENINKENNSESDSENSSKNDSKNDSENDSQSESNLQSRSESYSQKEPNEKSKPPTRRIFTKPINTKLDSEIFEKDKNDKPEIKPKRIYIKR